ncbi:hypothetical protein EK21DRAFT_73562 [Setomelanomma holmii]|uniref:Uncharacterized protein n=1 Tax=Setomelanomma holmii TaxID=210430 RepID=A0A9P4LJK2_9PLEO|nr:hypothetical protein EK21DRAFT_73562 [Setomelanomma holmii]
MLANKDPNGPGSGRASRASNASGMSRNTNSKHPGEGGGMPGQDHLSTTAPGVMSMLRTSTEMGNVAGLTGDTSGFSNIPRAPQRRGASSRLSTASSLSNHSNYNSRQHRQRASSSSAARYSMTRDAMPPMPTVPQYVPDTLSPTMMNLAGSSPMVPVSRYDRNSQRSLSMTNSMPQPEFRLANNNYNRSMGSLRSHDAQRPKSPLGYPTRLRRHGLRPTSPAWSEAPGSQPRRMHGPGGPGPACPSGAAHPRDRLRIPSDSSLGGYQDRVPRMPRQPSRGPSPVFYQRPNGVDVPSMPPLSQHYHPAIKQARRLNRSVKGSVSSGSTNMRTDSDTPSSDLPLPPTPREGASMNALAGSTDTRMMRVATNRVMMEQVFSSQDYYDYSEPFEREALVKPEAEPLPTGYAHIIKSSFDAQMSIRPPAHLRSGPGVENPGRRVKNNIDHRRSNVSGIAELPASPVAPRITKALIKDALESVSTTGDIESSLSSPAAQTQNAPHRQSQDQATTRPIGDETSGSSALPVPAGASRNNVLSQEGSSLVDSSTVELAVRCSNAMTGTVHPDSDSVPASPGSPEKSTEDGMSDVLAGYQHTDSKQETDVVPHAVAGHKSEPAADDISEKKCKHTPQSSDEQSFKSCTDIPEPVSPEVEKDDGGTLSKSTHDDPANEQLPVKESDARSAKTAQDVSTPVRAKSMPSSVIASSSQAGMNPQARPASDMPPATPAQKIHRQPVVPPRESSFSTIASRILGNSKASLKQGSMSISGSSSTLSGGHQPPPVPPRDSSASKEAHRFRDVGTFLMRFKPKMPTLKKDRSMKEDALSRDDALAKQKHQGPTFEPSQQIKEPDKPVSTSDQRMDNLETPEKAVLKDHVIAEKSRASPPIEYDDPSKSLHEDTTTDLRLSGYRYNMPQRYLPDLKEESHEDSSLNTSTSNLKSSHFRFPYGVGPGMRTSVDDAIVFSRRSSTRSHRKSALGGVHGLPTMEFSQANLLDKLNDALGGIRFSRSLGNLRLDLLDVGEGSPQRSASVGEVRERAHDILNGLGEVENMGGGSKFRGVIDVAKPKRAFSPEKLMAELDQVTIPSVGPLTQRFTEMLPSLSLDEYYRRNGLGEPGEFPDEEEIMEHAIEEIHEVHPPSQKRSSARLRPIRGSSALMVMEDDVYEEMTNRARGGVGSADQGHGPAEVRAGEVDARAGSTDNTTTSSATRQLSPVAELQAPSPVVLRPRSHTIADQALRTSIESALSSRRSLRSFVSTPTATDTRPWNFDKNYPWATTSLPSVDISLPAPSAIKASPRAGPSHLRNTLSDASSSTFASTRTPTTSPTGKASSSNANRQSHRLSTFGRSGDQPHAVGERYPTSALSPPTAIFRDHLSTCDTSDDEDFTTSRKNNKLTLRKRFSSAARNNTLTHTTPRVARGKVNPAELASPASDQINSSSTLQDHFGEQNAFTSNRHTFREAQGYPVGAYHRRRFVERIRQLWQRGQAMVRSLSRHG